MSTTRINNRLYSPTDRSSMSNAYDVFSQAPHDTRLVINKAADLILEDTWKSYKSNGDTLSSTPAVYTGLVTWCVEEQNLYALNDASAWFKFAGEEAYGLSNIEPGLFNDYATMFASANAENKYTALEDFENAFTPYINPNNRNQFIYVIENTEDTLKKTLFDYAKTHDYNFTTLTNLGWSQIKTDLTQIEGQLGSLFNGTDDDKVIKPELLGGDKDTPLFEGGKINSKYLPSYVDDVIEVKVASAIQNGTPKIFNYTNTTENQNAGDPVEPSSGVLYIVTEAGSTNVKPGSIWRYAGPKSGYVQISGGSDTDSRVTAIEGQLTWKTLELPELDDDGGKTEIGGKDHID